MADVSKKVEKFICSLSNFADSENQRLGDEVRPVIGSQTTEGSSTGLGTPLFCERELGYMEAIRTCLPDLNQRQQPPIIVPSNHAAICF